MAIKIAVYGTGRDGRNFYYDHDPNYEIVCFIATKPRYGELLYLPLYSFEDFEKNYYNEHLLIVVANRKNQGEIFGNLLNKCYRKGIDFIPFEWLEKQINYWEMRQVLSENEALFLLRMRLDVEQKKLCVLYGNCQILSLAQYFLHCKDFCRNFLLFVIPPVYAFPSIKSQDLLYENFWELASFFV